MSFNNTTALLKGGNINVFQLEEQGSYLLVMPFADKSFVVPLLNRASAGYTTYISSKYTEEDSENIKGLMAKTFNIWYKSLPNFSYCSDRAIPTHSKKVVNFVSGPGNKAKQEILDKILTDEGYDISELGKELATPVQVRDYSALRKNPDAQEAFNEVEDLMKKYDIDFDSVSPVIKLLRESILSNKLLGVLFVGPAGTGKSFNAYVLAHSMGAPLLTYQATEGMEVEDLMGRFIPSSKQGQQFEFAPGPLLKAYSQGYQIVINEVNMAPGGVLSIFNQLADDTPSITGPDQKLYKRHPNFVLYFTMNAGYEGTNVLNAALKSRFPIVTVGRLTEAVFVSRMMEYSKKVAGNELSIDFFKALYEFGNYITAFVGTYGENAEVCIRNAQKMTDAILLKSRTYEEFAEIVYFSYMNLLSLDHDNYDQLEELKHSSDMIGKIKALYKLYDYREIECVEITNNYTDSVTAGRTAKPAREVDDFSEEEVDLLGGLDDKAADSLVNSIIGDTEEEAKTEDTDSTDENK